MGAETNRRIADNSLNANDAASALAAWEKIDSVLGIGSNPNFIPQSRR